MRHRGPPSDTCCPLKGLPSTHATLHLVGMTGVLEEGEGAQRREKGRRGLRKNERSRGVWGVKTRRYEKIKPEKKRERKDRGVWRATVW